MADAEPIAKRACVAKEFFPAEEPAAPPLIDRFFKVLSLHMREQRDQQDTDHRVVTSMVTTFSHMLSEKRQERLLVLAEAEGTVAAWEGDGDPECLVAQLVKVIASLKECT